MSLEVGGCQKEETTRMTVREGLVNGERVRVLRDTGCSTVVVRRGLVRRDRFTGERKRCALMNGVTIEFV